MAMKTPQMRKCRWFASVAVFLLAVSSSVAVQATEANSFAIGRWTGQASVSDAERAFVACRATANDRANTSISLEVDRQANWSLELANQGWHLPVSRHYLLRLSVDGGPNLDWDSVANTATVLTAKLGTDQTLLSLLRRGKALRVTSGSFDRTYDLTGSADAVDQLISCRSSAMGKEATDSAVGNLIGYAASTLGIAWVAAWLVPMAPVVETGLLYAVASRATLQASPTIILTSTAQRQATPHETPPPTLPRSAPPSEVASLNDIEVPVEDDAGTFLVSVAINDVITLKFTVDSGASSIMLPVDVVRTLARAGTVEDSDFRETKHYTMADGSSADQETLLLHTVRVGDFELRGVEASVGPQEGSLLLGQSFLGQFESWSIDNARHLLILRPKATGAVNEVYHSPVE